MAKEKRGFARNPALAREAGRIGGKNQGKENNPGNFANRPRKEARAAGRKGGKS